MDDDFHIRNLEAKGYRICRDAAAIFIHCLTGRDAEDFVIRDPQSRITTYVSNGDCARDPLIDDGFRYPG